MSLLFLLFLPLISHGASFSGDALLGKVGREPVLLSDLMRYRDVEGVMVCAKLRQAPAEEEKEKLPLLLNRFIEEELIASEARTKRSGIVRLLGEAVEAIHADRNCRRRWQDLGHRYGTLWNTSAHPREGETMLVRELEKRMLVDHYLKTEAITDRGIWLREVKTKNPVKIFLD